MTFTMWSVGHYLFILAPFFFTAILHYFTRNYNYEKKRLIGIKLSWIAVHILFLRNLEIWINSDYAFNVELVPLQVCHFANFVLLYAFIKDSKPVFGFAFTVNLIAAFVSILFADGLANYTSILNLRGQAYIWGHIIIVVISLWAFLNDFVDLKKDIFIKAMKITYILYFSSILVNNFFGIVFNQYSNYFYTNHPEKGTPLEWFWNTGVEWNLGGFKINLIYIILSSILVFGVMMMMYGVSKLRKSNA